MNRRALYAVCLALMSSACSKKEPDRHEHKVTAADELEDAGDDVGLLCLFIDKHPGTPEAAKALDQVKARYAAAAAALPKAVADRKVEPHVAAVLDAVVRAAAGHECNHLVGVAVDVKFDDSVTRYATHTAGDDFGGMVKNTWPYDDRSKLGGDIAVALEEMSGGWLSAVDMSAPSNLTFELNVVTDGRVAIGDVATMPGLAIQPTLVAQPPGGAAERVPLEPLTIEVGGTVEYRKSNSVTHSLDEAGSAEFDAIKQITSSLAGRVPALPGRVGLAAAGDPRLAAFTGFHVSAVKVLENPCQIAGPAVGDELGVDAIKRTFKASIIADPARIENDHLVSTSRVRDVGCNLPDVSRWELARTGDHLEGTYTTTWASDEDCNKSCVFRAEVTGEKAAP